MITHKDIEQIKIGTCLPGQCAEEWAPHMAKLGFETFAVNFHMQYYGIDIVEQGPRMKEFAAENGMEITTLGFYCNPVQFDDHVQGLKHAIKNAHLYGAKTVSTFAGAYEGKAIPESYKRFGEVFRELSKLAEDNGVRIAIENCPMGGSWQHATCNIAINPRSWEVMFNEVTCDALGLEWEPAHQMIQLIDPIAQLNKWAPKVYHVHGKDATINRAKIAEYGVLCDTDEYAPERTPGFGDSNWRDIIYILHQNGYNSDICVEGYHDPIYKDQWELTAQKHALNYLKWCRGGDFIETPWAPIHYAEH